MVGGSLSLKLLRTIDGVYKPREDELWGLAEVARLNKLYLAFLRSVDCGVFWRERVVEEARFRRYMRSVVDVVGALRGLRYALYKFRRPVDHVSVDLDVLVHVDDVSRAVARLRSRGFRVVVVEPYTVTLRRRGFIVDLYTYPALLGLFTWMVGGWLGIIPRTLRLMVSWLGVLQGMLRSLLQLLMLFIRSI